MSRIYRVHLLKTLRKQFIKIAMNEPLPDIDGRWIKYIRTESGNFTYLSAIQTRVSQCDNFCSAAMTILGKSRDLNLVPTIDISSIEDKSKVPESNIDIVNKEITNSGMNLGIPRDEIDGGDNVYPSLYYSTKQGPNGPATSSAILEINKYSEEEGTDIHKIMKTYVPSYHEYGNLDGIKKFVNVEISSRIKTVYLRRLSSIADYEGKTRVIAIGDGLSQIYLRPLHDKIMQKIRKIPGDLTYNHSEIPKKVHQMGNKKDRTRFNPYSIDLVSATDRLPAKISSHVLGELWGDEIIARNGLKIMTKGDFVTPLSADCNRNIVRYSVGQPMGLYTSWPTLALTNHVLVRLAAVRIGVNKFSDYFVLGDDLVIFNKEVANSYLLLCEEIGVETKPSDSIHPKDSHSLEIAKRLFRNGVEVSPLPLKLMEQAYGLFALTAIDRGFASSLELLYSEDDQKIIPTLAAALLNYGRLCPLGPRGIGQKQAPDLSTTISQAEMLLSKTESDSDRTTIFGDSVAYGGTLGGVNHYAHESRFPEGAYCIFNKGCTVESYKVFNAYETATQSKVPRKLRRKLLTSLPTKMRHTRLNDRFFKDSMNEWLDSEVISKSIKNSTTYSYMTNQHSYLSPNEVMSCTELFESYQDSLVEIRQGLVVEAHQVILNKIETVDNQMIMGIEKILRESDLSHEDLKDRCNFILLTIKELQSAKSEE